MTFSALPIAAVTFQVTGGAVTADPPQKDLIKPVMAGGAIGVFADPSDHLWLAVQTPSEGVFVALRQK